MDATDTEAALEVLEAEEEVASILFVTEAGRADLPVLLGGVAAEAEAAVGAGAEVRPEPVLTTCLVGAAARRRLGVEVARDTKSVVAALPAVASMVAGVEAAARSVSGAAGAPL